jgi:hypothetical protein
MHNRSVMVAVHGMPSVIPPCNSKTNCFSLNCKLKTHFWHLRFECKDVICSPENRGIHHSEALVTNYETMLCHKTKDNS